VQTRVARARDRAPTPTRAKDEEDVVELVLRCETQQERRITVLFEDDGGDKRGFETVGRAVPQRRAKNAAPARASARSR
jgi:hypothetical protein